MTSREQVVWWYPLVVDRLKTLSFKNAVKGLEVASQFNDGSLSEAEAGRATRLVQAINQVLEIVNEND